jgi:hypothetical protein
MKNELELKKSKKKHKKCKLINKNIVRKISDYILGIIRQNGIKNSLIGVYYSFIHFCIFILVGVNLLFNTNLNHLFILLIIVSIDAISIVILHSCPLTQLEEKYLGINACEEKTSQMKQLGIFYTCKHEYERQLEILVNAWSLIAVKCMMIIIFKLFNFKLANVYDLYK